MFFGALLNKGTVKISSALAEDILLETETHTFGFFYATNLADDCLLAALALRDWLGEAHL